MQPNEKDLNSHARTPAQQLTIDLTTEHLGISHHLCFGYRTPLISQQIPQNVNGNVFLVARRPNAPPTIATIRRQIDGQEIRVHHR